MTLTSWLSLTVRSRTLLPVKGRDCLLPNLLLSSVEGAQALLKAVRYGLQSSVVPVDRLRDSNFLTEIGESRLRPVSIYRFCGHNMKPTPH